MDCMNVGVVSLNLWPGLELNANYFLHVLSFQTIFLIPSKTHVFNYIKFYKRGVFYASPQMLSSTFDFIECSQHVKKNPV